MRILGPRGFVCDKTLNCLGKLFRVIRRNHNASFARFHRACESADVRNDDRQALVASTWLESPDKDQIADPLVVVREIHRREELLGDARLYRYRFLKMRS